MASEPYLLRLAERLARGTSLLDPQQSQRHGRFVLSRQNADGGFSGREGDSDLYYTGFAVRCLAMLGRLDAEHADRVAGFLQAHQPGRLSIVDQFSRLYAGMVIQASGGPDVFADAGWIDRIADSLERVRTPDGGYAKTPEGAAGSTYHTFLVALAYELLGQSLPNPDALVQFVYDRQRDDGGFVEIAPMKRSGTNPTAAAVALLLMFNAMDGELREDVREFLTAVRSPEGGFQANSRIPFADGLSTFTGLLTLRDLDLQGVVDPSTVDRFIVEQLEFPAGGFRGASWDEQADVEYTFYGLAVLALLRDAGS